MFHRNVIDFVVSRILLQINLIIPKPPMVEQHDLNREIK